MPTVEIDESELKQYQNVAKYLQGALSNPKTRRKALEIQKELNPNAVIPELDSQAPVLDAVAALRKDLDDEKAARAKDKEDREQAEKLGALKQRWDSGRQMARDAGYSDEGLTELEKFMEAEGIASHEHAMAAYERKHPRPAPTARGSNIFGGLNVLENRGHDDLKPLFEGNPDQWLNKAISQAMGEAA